MMNTTRSRIAEMQPLPGSEFKNHDAADDTFHRQAARILEHIEILESQYSEEIQDSGADLKNGLRICALALRGSLEEAGTLCVERIEALAS